MSTLGVAHHQRGTLPKVDTEAENEARRARYAEKDAAYRAALGLEPWDELPAIIGRAPGGAMRRGYEVCADGGRRRLRSATL